MRPELDRAEVSERDGDADRAVAAHAEIADVVEEDDPDDAGRVGRFAEHRADHHVRAAGLVHHGRAEAVVPVAKDRQPLGHRPPAQVGRTREDDPRGLAAGVGVDHADAMDLV